MLLFSFLVFAFELSECEKYKLYLMKLTFQNKS